MPKTCNPLNNGVDKAQGSSSRIEWPKKTCDTCVIKSFFNARTLYRIWKSKEVQNDRTISTIAFYSRPWLEIRGNHGGIAIIEL